MENPGVQGWPDRATLTNRQGLFITHEPIGLSMLTVGFEYMADIIDNLIQHVVHCLIIFDLPVTIQKVIFEFTIQTIRSCTLLWIWEFCYIEEIEFLTYKIFLLGSSPILRSIPLALKPFNGMTILFPLNLYRQHIPVVDLHLGVNNALFIGVATIHIYLGQRFLIRLSDFFDL